MSFLDYVGFLVALLGNGLLGRFITKKNWGTSVLAGLCISGSILAITGWFAPIYTRQIIFILFFLGFLNLLKELKSFKNLPDNVIISDQSMQYDIERSDWAIYRSSTAIIQTLRQEVRPIYLQLEGEITVDPLYEIEKWKAVAYTLRARYYMHWVEKVNGETDIPNCNSALDNAELGITTLDGTMQTLHGTESSEQNIWYQFDFSRAGYMAAGANLVDLLKRNSDPRDSIYFGYNNAGSIVGANPDNNGPKGKSYLNDEYFRSDASIDILSYEENLLIQAECQYRLGNESEAQTKLQAAQTVAEEKWGFEEDTFSDISSSLTGFDLLNKILEEKSKKFTEQNKLNMSETLTPLREQLGDFKKKIEDVYDKETRDRVSLFKEITSLRSLNQQMSKDAINLTRALKGESKTRGNWGEVILQRVLEDSGLKNGREYESQRSYRDQHGNNFQPDVVVHLPDNKDVVIDSKVSLIAYEKYCSLEDGEEQKQALAEHLNSIRKHVTELQGKNYDELANINSLDMVLMFVPIEPALMLAMEKDENLSSDAYPKVFFFGLAVWQNSVQACPGTNYGAKT